MGKRTRPTTTLSLLAIKLCRAVFAVHLIVISALRRSKNGLSGLLFFQYLADDRSTLQMPLQCLSIILSVSDWNNQIK